MPSNILTGFYWRIPTEWYARYATDLCEFTPSPQVAVPASSSVPMVSVSPPLRDAMDTGHALMEVMR